MSFKINSGQPLNDNVRAVAYEQIDRAASKLSSCHSGEIDEAVHEARKCFKRLRALLRLVRPALGKSLYRQENLRLRDLGRSLSDIRDASALLETHDQLGQQYQHQVDWQRMQPVRQLLASHGSAIRPASENFTGRLATYQGQLQTLRTSVSQWPLQRLGSRTIGKGNKRIYRRARKYWKKARHQQQAELLHDWRKQVKYLRYHYQLLKGTGSSKMKKRHRQHKQLGEILGEYHDLDVLREQLDQLPRSTPDAVAECEYRTLLRERQNQLYRQSLKIGKRLFKAKPGAHRQGLPDP